MKNIVFLGTVRLITACSLLILVSIILMTPVSAITKATTSVTTLSATANAGVNTISVASTSGINLGDVLIINPGQAGEEIIRVGGFTSNTITLASKATLARTHNSGVAIHKPGEDDLFYGISGNRDDNGNAMSRLEHDSSVAGNFQNQFEQPNNIAATRGPHGRYTTSTNACGRCHQLHRAPTRRLIRFETSSAANPTYGTCTYCHSFNGQSTYNVKDGMIWDTNNGERYATSGGGFERMLVVDGPPSVATVVQVSAKHIVDAPSITDEFGNVSFVRFNAPGGVVSDNHDGHIALTCSSCHQPHGTKNDRLLVETASGFSTDGGGGRVAIKVNNPFAKEQTQYNARMNTFCGSCHRDYNTDAGGTQKSGNYEEQFYRHKMGVAANAGLNNNESGNNDFGFEANRLALPLSNINDNHSTSGSQIICITCHYAHGTYVQVDGIRATDRINLNSTTALNTGYETPKNLRMDNRGVCQNCHNRQRSTAAPILVNVLNPEQNGKAQYGSPASLTGNLQHVPQPNIIMLRFNEYMWRDRANPTTQTNSIERRENYLINNGAVTVNRVSLAPDGRTVVIYLNSNLPSGTVTVRMNNIRDLNFNLVPANYTHTFTYNP